jgi:hypothetical protein
MTFLTFLTDPAVHVLPSNDNLSPLDGHTPSPWCECKPTVSDESSPHGVIWIHKFDS